MTCAIVLAAGESRRMGCQKLLLPFGSTRRPTGRPSTVIAHIVDQLLHSAVDDVVVVVGHLGDRVAAELSGWPVTVVDNPDYARGMLSSVRCGLRSLPRPCQSILAALGDQPAITSKLVDDLLLAFAKSGKGILVPVYAGKRGHPVLFSAMYREEILTHYDDEGLRGLLRAHPGDVHEIAVGTPSVLTDMDYPKEYQRERAAFSERDASQQ